MNKEEFRKNWKKFLIDIGLSETQLSKEIGQSQNNLNKKIVNGSIRYIELADIVEKYGYTIEIRKKSE